jgi:hypothetical protein
MLCCKAVDGGRLLRPVLILEFAHLVQQSLGTSAWFLSCVFVDICNQGKSVIHICSAYRGLVMTDQNADNEFWCMSSCLDVRSECIGYLWLAAQYTAVSLLWSPGLRVTLQGL